MKQNKRSRMIFDLSPEMAMCIRLLAVEKFKSTSEMLKEIIESQYSKKIQECKKIIEKNNEQNESK